MARDDPDCHVEDGTVRCEIGGDEVEMIDSYVRDDLALVDMDTCADVNEDILDRYAEFGEEESGRVVSAQFGGFYLGCPVPHFDFEQDVELELEEEIAHE